MLLHAENVTKTFSMGGRPLCVVNGATVDIDRGEIVAIVGPSGAGKSTLLQILGLVDRPSTGEVYYEGRALGRLSERERANHRNRHFGFVFQFFHLLPELTALENALLPNMIGTSFLAWPKHRGRYRSRAEDVLRRLGLGGRLHHRPSQLSGGERQRVAIARALSNDPAVIFCDEPTGNLDHGTSEEIRRALWDLNRSLGTTFVIVTHHEALAREAHRVLHMEDGRIVNGEEAAAAAAARLAARVSPDPEGAAPGHAPLLDAVAKPDPEAPPRRLGRGDMPPAPPPEFLPPARGPAPGREAEPPGQA